MEKKIKIALMFVTLCLISLLSVVAVSRVGMGAIVLNTTGKINVSVEYGCMVSDNYSIYVDFDDNQINKTVTYSSSVIFDGVRHCGLGNEKTVSYNASTLRNTLTQSIKDDFEQSYQKWSGHKERKTYSTRGRYN